MQTIFLSLLFGIIAGLTYSIPRSINNFLGKTKFGYLFVYTLSSLAIGIIFTYFSIKFNHGTFRLYTLCGFLLGIITENFTIGNILDNIFSIIYNLITKIFKVVTNFLNTKRRLRHESKRLKQLN